MVVEQKQKQNSHYVTHSKNTSVRVSLFRGNNMGVHDYLEIWFEQYVVKNLKYNTQLNYRNILDKYVLSSIGKYRIQAVSPASLQHLVDELPTDKLAKHTVEIIVSVIKKLFKWPCSLISTSKKIRHSTSPCQHIPKIRRNYIGNHAII